MKAAISTPMLCTKSPRTWMKAARTLMLVVVRGAREPTSTSGSSGFAPPPWVETGWWWCACPKRPWPWLWGVQQPWSTKPSLNKNTHRVEFRILPKRCEGMDSKQTWTIDTHTRNTYDDLRGALGVKEIDLDFLSHNIPMLTLFKVVG